MIFLEIILNVRYFYSWSFSFGDWSLIRHTITVLARREGLIQWRSYRRCRWCIAWIWQTHLKWAKLSSNLFKFSPSWFENLVTPLIWPETLLGFEVAIFLQKWRKKCAYSLKNIRVNNLLSDSSNFNSWKGFSCRKLKISIVRTFYSLKISKNWQ